MISIPSASYAGPVVALSVRDIASNISCRIKARSKFLELGGTGLPDASENSQWADINGMTPVVWCRNTQAFIAVSGTNSNAVTELRDEISKIF